MRIFTLASLAIVCLAAAPAAGAQSPTVVHVAVTDTLGIPVADASVRLIRDSTTIRSGRTAADGTYRFALDAAPTELVLATQKVGFVSTRRRVIAAPGATTDVGILVTPVATLLDSVRVTARGTANDVVPTITADEIAASSRNLVGLFRVIAKLRPRAMVTTPRRAARPCLKTQSRLYINEQWVNPAQYDALSQFPPDQIALIQFVDCFDRSIDANDHPGARHTYVTLKPGVHYSPAGGVVVDSTIVRDAGKMADSGKALRVNRGKLIGVYDELNGDPLAGVKITDVSTGMFVQTTATGTASLFFTRNDATMLGVTKLGYRPMTMVIGDPWSDTIPITVTMMPRGVSTVETKRLAPSDTVQKLVAAGFYDRRAWANAPTNAFLATADLRGAKSIGDAAKGAGRPLCESAVYVDGAFTNIAAALQSLPESSRTIDELFPLSLVLAVETYVSGEIPPQFDRWNEKGATMFDAPKKSSRCVTVIWTR